MQENDPREDYRAMHLSHDLRDEILQREEVRRRQRKRRGHFLQAAACLCVCVLLGAALLPGRGGVYADGGKLGASKQTAAVQSVSYNGLARSGSSETAEDCVALTMRYGKTVVLTVDAGMLLLPEETDGACRYSGQSAVVQDGGCVYWCLAGCDGAAPVKATLCTETGRSVAVLTAAFDGQWQLSLK